MTEIINLKLTAMAHGGEALGRDAQGRVVFVPYAIAGEEVRVEIIAAKKEFARARLVEVITPSPARVTPRCPHFGQPSSSRGIGCGGCQWQHIAYNAQIEFKQQIVREQFARIGKMPDAPVATTRAAVKPWHYRNHMRFALNENSEMCLQALESHALIPIRECHLTNASLSATFNTLALEGADFDAVTLRASERTNDRLILFEATDTEPPEIETDEPISIAFQIRQTVMTLIGKETIAEQIRARTFQISPRAFFQVNTPMAEELLTLVEQFLAPRADDVLLDAYGGVGLFGLSLAPRVAQVIEIEENPAAIENARCNAQDLTNVEFHAGRVEDILPKLTSVTSLAIVDPPRAGMARAPLDALVTKSPRVIVYVSCDPATLARDARRLVDAGYHLMDIQPVDLFPQTYHIECVARFERTLVGITKTPS